MTVIDRIHELRCADPASTVSLQADLMERGESRLSVLADSLHQAQDLRLQINQLHPELHQLEAFYRFCTTSSQAFSGDLLEQARTKTSSLNCKLLALKAEYSRHAASSDSSLNAHQIRIKRAKLQNIGKSLQTLTLSLLDSEKAFKAECNSRLRTRLQIALPASTSGQEFEDLVQEASGEILLNSQTQMFNPAASSVQGLLLKHQDLQARHEDLLELENGMQELAEAFLHLSTLIVQQGELIDQVEDALEYTDEKIVKATGQIVSGAKKARMKRILKLVLLCVVILLILAVFGFLQFQLNIITCGCCGLLRK
jgi:syntaxin 1B/2/3